MTQVSVLTTTLNCAHCQYFIANTTHHSLASTAQLHMSVAALRATDHDLLLISVHTVTICLIIFMAREKCDQYSQSHLITSEKLSV